MSNEKERAYFKRYKEDVKRDGKPDIVAVSSTVVTTHLGDGNGGFTAGPVSSVGARSLRDLVLGEIADIRVRADAGIGEEPARRRLADPVDVRETDLDALRASADRRDSSRRACSP